MSGAALAPAIPAAVAAGPLGWALLGLTVVGLTAATIWAASKGADHVFKSEETSCVEGCPDQGNEVTVDEKIKKQLGERGWSEQDLKDAVNGPPAGTTTDNRSPSKTADGQGRNDPATVYGSKEGYVVVNDRTREVVQVSDKNPGSGWVPDSRIKWNEGP